MKNVFLTTALVTAMFAGTASAHTINGGTFGATSNNPEAADIYHTTCFQWGGLHGAAPVGETTDAATRLRFTIRGTNSLTGNTGTNKVKLTVGKTVWNAATSTYSALSASTTDSTNNDGVVATDFVGTGGSAPAGYSPATSVNGGLGDYTLVVTHSASGLGAANGTGTNGYDIILHCQAVVGGIINHVGTGSFAPGQEATQALPNGDYDVLLNK